MLVGGFERAVDVRHRERAVAGEQETVRDGAHVPNLATDVTRFRRGGQGLLDQAHRFSGIAAKKCD